MDSLQAIAAVCGDLYGNSELDKKLKNATVWALSQRRHLIVHRRAIVDEQYISKTSDTIPLGDAVVISVPELKSYLLEVRDIGLEIANSAFDLVAGFGRESRGVDGLPG